MSNGPFSRRRLIEKINTLNSNFSLTYPLITGTLLFVSSTAGTNAVDRGTTPATPLASLEYAINLIAQSAEKNHVIVLMPNHAETVNAAAFATIDVDKLHILGIGVGRKRPVLTWSATDATIVVTGDGVKIENLVFDLTGIDAVVSGFVCDGADDLSFVNCEFQTNSGTAGCVSGITIGTTTACDRFVIENCRFLGPATNTGTTSTAQITITKGVDYLIRNSYFTGKCTQNITNGAAVLRGQIDNCRFVTYTGTKSINMHASSTPFITNCRFNVPSGTAPIVAAAGFVAGNVYSAAAGVTAGTASTF